MQDDKATAETTDPVVRERLISYYDRGRSLLHGMLPAFSHRQPQDQVLAQMHSRAKLIASELEDAYQAGRKEAERTGR